MPAPQIERSADFRYIYANAFKVQLTGNDMTVKFCFNEDPTKPDLLLEQTAIVCTLTSAKTLAYVLTEALGKFEADNKITIPFEKSKMEEVMKNMTVNTIPNKVK